MKQEIKGMIEGFYNLLSKKEMVEDISAKRLVICGACPFKKGNSCGVCGCWIPSLTRAIANKQCPKGYFHKAIIDRHDKLIEDGLPKENQDKQP